MKKKIKNIFDKLLKSKLFKYLLTRLFFLSFAVLFGELYVNLNIFPQEVIISITGSLILLMFTNDVLNFVKYLSNYYDRKSMSKIDFSTKLNLYGWASTVRFEKFLYSILSEEASNNPIENLQDTKRKIINACSGNLGNLYLLKGYIQLNISNNNFEKYWTLFIGALIGGITSNLSKSMGFIEKVYSILFGEKVSLETSSITTIITYVTHSIIAIWIFVEFLEHYKKDRRRLNLINEIVNISIRELECKENIVQFTTDGQEDTQ